MTTFALQNTWTVASGNVLTASPNLSALVQSEKPFTVPSPWKFATTSFPVITYDLSASVLASTPFTLKKPTYPPSGNYVLTAIDDVVTKQVATFSMPMNVLKPWLPPSGNYIAAVITDLYSAGALQFQFYYPSNGKIPGSPIPKHGQLLPRPL